MEVSSTKFDGNPSGGRRVDSADRHVYEETNRGLFVI